jgi:hypothetical protein
MTLRLTPDMLAAGYDFLRTTEPFKGWKLPESDDIGFAVVRDPKMHADFGVENGTPIIRVSENGAGHTITLLASLGHEMCHLRQHLKGYRDAHGASFKAMAKRVCAAHGFDIKTF